MAGKEVREGQPESKAGADVKKCSSGQAGGGPGTSNVSRTPLEASSEGRTLQNPAESRPQGPAAAQEEPEI